MRRMVNRWESQPALDLRGSSWLRTHILAEPKKFEYGGVERNWRLRRPTLNQTAPVSRDSELERSETELERDGRLRRPTFR
jgi:hypothetical protein